MRKITLRDPPAPAVLRWRTPARLPVDFSNPLTPPPLPPAPRKKSVLVVDDLESTRELVGLILQGAGYEVHHAKDGKTALAAAEKLCPHAVLLDILMPQVDGFTVCKQIKEHPRLAGVKVILFSALNSQADKYRAEEMGADAFLEKPVEGEKLLDLLKSVLA